LEAPAERTLNLIRNDKSTLPRTSPPGDIPNPVFNCDFFFPAASHEKVLNITAAKTAARGIRSTPGHWRATDKTFREHRRPSDASGILFPPLKGLVLVNPTSSS